MLADVRDRFESAYAGLLRGVAATGLPTVICTVYEPRFPDPPVRRAASAALCLFNDAIVRAAQTAGLPVLEMRSVCSRDAHFANPIEPSSTGGEAIARALLEVVRHHDFAGRRAALYP